MQLGKSVQLSHIVSQKVSEFEAQLKQLELQLLLMEQIGLSDQTAGQCPACGHQLSARAALHQINVEGVPTDDSGRISIMGIAFTLRTLSAFRNKGLPLTDAEVPGWEERAKDFLGGIPDANIAACVGASLKKVCKLRRKLCIERATYERTIEVWLRLCQ